MSTMIDQLQRIIDRLEAEKYRLKHQLNFQLARVEHLENQMRIADLDRQKAAFNPAHPELKPRRFHDHDAEGAMPIPGILPRTREKRVRQPMAGKSKLRITYHVVVIHGVPSRSSERCKPWTPEEGSPLDIGEAAPVLGQHVT